MYMCTVIVCTHALRILSLGGTVTDYENKLEHKTENSCGYEIRHKYLMLRMSHSYHWAGLKFIQKGDFCHFHFVQMTEEDIISYLNGMR